MVHTIGTLTQEEKTKLVLFFVDYYAHQERETYKRDQAMIAQKVRYYTKLHPYTRDETWILKELDPHFKKMLDMQLSYQVFAFEILALWAQDVPKEQRPLLNISDHKLKKGHRHYFKELLTLKKRNGYKYKQTKAIMEISIEKAAEFYNFVNKYQKEKK